MNWIAEVLENHMKVRPGHHFIFDEKTPEGLTFAQFYDLSGRVYAYLKAKGIGKEDFVLINLSRGINPFAALMGVWRTGAAFVMVEHTDPGERIEYIRADCSCKLEINEDVWTEILNTEPLSGYENVDEHDAAYAVYTSGSTGNPKGVLHEYGNLVETFYSHFYQGQSLFGADDKFALTASLSVIPSLFAFHHALTIAEPELHVISLETVKNQWQLKDYLLRKQITTMFITPSYFRLLAEELTPCLRTIILAAEPAGNIKPPKNVTVYNCYGMSESGFAICLFKIDKEYDLCPVGCPQFDKKIYLLDEDGKEVPEGETGEICFADPFVRGFINLPEENKVAFQKGIFHTNDLAHKLVDGNYVIVGRKSEMLKINGNRVEPAEVEAVLRKTLNIAWCAVKGFSEGENAYLAAYYTADISAADLDEARKKLVQKIPGYMVPTYFVKLDTIPISKNGKLDRKALPRPAVRAAAIVPPATEFEQEIFSIVADELQNRDFGVTTNLISLGLSSIRAIKLSVRIQRETGYLLWTADILSHPYIREWINFADRKQEIIVSLAPQATYPLTPNQMGIFTDWERHKKALQYNVPDVWRLKVAPGKLLQALNKVIEAHPYLKVHLRQEESGDIVQVRRDGAKLPVLYEKLDREPDKDFFQQKVRPFDLLKDDLARFAIYYTDKNVYLFKNIHHILFDGTSESIFTAELLKSIAGAELSPEEVTAYDYALYLEKWRQSKGYGEADKYFSKLLAGTASFAYPTVNSTVRATGKSEILIGKMPKQGIKNYCLKLGITENAFFATVLTQVFQRMSREDTIQIATVSNGRSLPQLMGTMGMYVQTLPLVSRGTKGSIGDLLKSMQEQIFSTISNDRYPYIDLVAKYGVQPNVLYAYQGDVIDRSSAGEPIRLETDTVKVPLYVEITPKKDTYDLLFEYDNGLYGEKEMAVLSRAVTTFAANIIEHPTDAGMESVSLVTAQEAGDLITLGTGEQLNYDKNKTFVDLFLEQVKKHPDAIAVVDYRSSLTYGELDRQSNILARELMQKGIGVNDFVAVKLPRIKEFMVAVVGIWKTGAAYVPIDLEYPQKRINYMLEDSGVKVVVDEEFLAGLASDKEAKPVNLAAPATYAYLIYTSGSTGKPKGTIISQGNLAAFIAWQCKTIALRAGDRIAEHASFSFDGSCIDLYPVLTVGGTLHILSSQLCADLGAMGEYFKKNSIKECFFTTTFAQMFLNNGETGLEYLLMGGEKNTGFKPAANTKVIDVYGPTEATSVTTTELVDQSFPDVDNIPLGRPMPNFVVGVVDSELNILPRGGVGELVLVGPQVSQGYWNRPELTKVKFVDCSFMPGATMYRTGDLVCWNDEGKLLFLGRTDLQVKLRGFRIELGEIEAVLSQTGNIQACAVAIKEINACQTLVAYYVAEEELNEGVLKGELAQTLAAYMVPERFVRLDKLPTTPNGKLDRGALPLPEQSIQEVVLPETEFEKEVFGIVADELKTRDFGVTTNLISLGLTSIKAIKLSCLVYNKTDCSLKTCDILAKPYIREWGKFAAKKETKIASFAPQATYPLTPNQLGVYIDWERNREEVQYNIPGVLKIQVEPGKLLAVVQQVLGMHPYFKVRLIRDVFGEVVLVRRDQEELPILFVKLDQEPDSDFFQRRVRPFDLFKEDLARFEIYYTDKNVYLFVDVHHIVFDGASVNILFAEVEKGCAGEALTGEQITAYDYALFLKDWQRSEDYAGAAKYFDNLIAGTESFTYPAVMSNAQATGKSKTFRGKVPMPAVKAYCFKLGVTENVFFATVLTQVFHRISWEDNIQIAVISNGRSMEQLNDTIGMFVQTLPLVSKKSRGRVGDLLKSMQEQIISTINYDKYPYTELVAKYGIKPNLMYAYQGDVLSVDGGLATTRLELDTVKFPLFVEITPEKDSYALSFEYDDGIYTEEEMAGLFRAVVNFVNNLLNRPADTQIETVALVAEDEAQELVALGTGEKLDYDKSKTFVDLFLEQVGKHPEQRAVVDCCTAITYAELDRQSDIVARELMQKGILPHDFVVVVLPRIKEFLVVVLGIWKAGAAYVPVDCNYPEERIKFVIEDSRSKIVVDREFLESINFNQEVKPVNLATPDKLAYIVYTSGSTGRPKGVMVSHGGLSAFLAWMSLELKLEPGVNIAEYASFSFDVSATEFFTALSTGATVHIIGCNLIKDFEAIAQYVKEQKIASCTFTTQIGIELLNTCNPEFTCMYVGGEKLKLTKDPHKSICNLYGPTEVSVWTSVHHVDFAKDREDIPIGRPAANLTVAIVDQYNNLLPKGMVGELTISGQQVTKGYLYRPELTAEKFLPSPFVQGERMFKTGDLVRWNENGDLLYVGRIDFQVKLRGFRIELGEIEAVLSKVDKIQSCVVAVKEINGIQHLVAYYVAVRELPEENLQRELSGILTEYMVPDVFVHLDKMPLNPNGKINRKMLPLPELKEQEIVPPRNGMEAQLLGMVQEILGTEKIGVTDDLMKCGLTSIQVLKLVALARKVKCMIKADDVFKFRTIRAIVSSTRIIGEWYKKFDPQKPVMVFVAGVVPFVHLQHLMEQIAEIYNCFFFESLLDYYDYMFKDETIEDVALLYNTLLDVQFPAGVKVDAFGGYCFGGEIAVVMANKYVAEHNEYPTLFLWETYLEEEKLQSISPGEIEKLLESIPREILEDTKEKIKAAEIRHLLLKGSSIEHYNGKCVYFEAAKEETDYPMLALLAESFEQRKNKNEALLKEYFPGIKIIEVDADHKTILAKTESDDLVL